MNPVKCAVIIANEVGEKIVFSASFLGKPIDGIGTIDAPKGDEWRTKRALRWMETDLLEAGFKMAVRPQGY